MKRLFKQNVNIWTVVVAQLVDNGHFQHQRAAVRIQSLAHFIYILS